MAVPCNFDSFEKKVEKSWKNDDGNLDRKVEGLWFYITQLAKNQFVVSEPDKNGVKVNEIECAKVFGNDPIAVPVMKEIIARELRNAKIHLFQPHVNAKEQDFNEIQRIIRTHCECKQLMAAGSNYTVVIGEVWDELGIWIWDLRKTKF